MVYFDGSQWEFLLCQALFWLIDGETDEADSNPRLKGVAGG